MQQVWTLSFEVPTVWLLVPVASYYQFFGQPHMASGKAEDGSCKQWDEDKPAPVGFLLRPQPLHYSWNFLETYSDVFGLHQRNGTLEWNARPRLCNVSSFHEQHPPPITTHCAKMCQDVPRRSSAIAWNSVPSSMRCSIVPRISQVSRDESVPWDV